jgi:hypothetical protein
MIFNFNLQFHFILFYYNFKGHNNSQFLSDYIILKYDLKIFTKTEADKDKVGEARSNPEKENPELSEPQEGRDNFIKIMEDFVTQNDFVSSLRENINNCKRLIGLMIFLAVFAYIVQSFLSIMK